MGVSSPAPLTEPIGLVQRDALMIMASQPAAITSIEVFEVAAGKMQFCEPVWNGQKYRIPDGLEVSKPFAKPSVVAPLDW